MGIKIMCKKNPGRNPILLNHLLILSLFLMVRPAEAHSTGAIPAEARSTGAIPAEALPAGSHDSDTSQFSSGAYEAVRGELRLMWYNVENLFHPSDDSLPGDDDFTPEGVRA